MTTDVGGQAGDYETPMWSLLPRLVSFVPFVSAPTDADMLAMSAES